MDLNFLLRSSGIDPEAVAVLRHSFSEKVKHRTLLNVANEDPELFNAFQSVQGKRVEDALDRLSGKGYVAGFVGNAPGKALFIGLFRITGSKPMRPDEIYSLPEYEKLDKIGLMTREEIANEFHRKFSMELVDNFSEWKGRLVIKWPPPELSWYRKAANNNMPILAIHEKSSLDVPIPNWRELSLAWDELKALPKTWKETLAHWRGIYFIFDESDGRGYVGSACGGENLLGRWLEYASTGHGGNKLLRQRSPSNFRFSVLERLSPDANPESVLHAESEWKIRLCTRTPHGLNDN